MKLKNKALWGAVTILPLAGCSVFANTSNTDIEDTSTQVTTTITVELSANDLNTVYDASTVETIAFNGNSIDASGANLSVNGSTLTISGAGDYLISGTLKDGQIIIAADKEDIVHIFFDGVNLTSEDGSPFVLLNADKVVLTLIEGSTNSITDGASYAATGDEDPDAAMYAKDDLTINGTGSLSVTSSEIGIHSSNDLILIDATVTVDSDKDGLKGKDKVILQDAIVTVNAGNDGIQSTNSVDQGAGYIAISGGVLNITSGLDGIQAQSQVLISSGELTVVSGTTAGSDQSGKAIRADLDLSIQGGNLTLTSESDDTLNSKDTLTISGGTLTLNASDDALHADETLLINGGDINILSSNEGLEAADVIINDGILHINASDDGINTSTGTVDYVKGGANMTQDDGSSLTITGGTIYLSALGDGVDSNGRITMSGGTLIAFGPTASNNGTLDYNQSFTLSGGTILAVGSSGMAQQASSSTINTVMVNLSTTLPSGTLVSILDSNGNLVVAFETIKTANSIVLASDTLAKGTYTVMTGGTLNGTLIDHATFSGTVSSGTQLTTFTIASTITTSGTATGGPGGGGVRPPRK